MRAEYPVTQELLYTTSHRPIGESPQPTQSWLAADEK